MDLVVLVMVEIPMGMAILVARATRIRAKTNQCAVIVDLQVTLWKSAMSFKDILLAIRPKERIQWLIKLEILSLELILGSWS